MEKSVKKEAVVVEEPFVEKRGAEEIAEPTAKKSKKEKKKKKLAEEKVEQKTEDKVDETPVKEKKSKKEAAVLERPAAKKSEKQSPDHHHLEDRVGGPDSIFKVVEIGLAYDCDQETVKSHFGECGEIVDFDMPVRRRVRHDTATAQCKGLAFITYANEAALTEALSKNGTEYNGRTVRVQIAEGRGAGARGAEGRGAGARGAEGRGAEGRGAEEERGPAEKGKGKKGKVLKPEGCKSVVIKNLSAETVEDSLWTFFQDAGTVQRVKLLTDRDTGESKRVAFVDFEATESTDNAVKRNASTLDGNTVYVDFNAPRREKGEGKKGKGKKGKGGKKGRGK